MKRGVPPARYYSIEVGKTCQQKVMKNLVEVAKSRCIKGFYVVEVYLFLYKDEKVVEVGV